ncbi:efflux transporter outer membrane subunit [Sphingosinicellaceae bacterium]|nr:efflux transporter outer membrane subunit [Sphingosinicellaceae bacterium]
MKRAGILLALLASACTVGPDYAPPALPTPPAYGEPQSTDTRPFDIARWWQGFGDPELNRLIAIALADSLDIQTAASRIRQARTDVRIARAEGLPTVDAMAGDNYIKLSKNAGISSLASQFGGGASGGGAAGGGSSGSGGGIALPGGGINTFSLGFDATWELDLFGGVRRGIEGAVARVDAAVWNARDAQVTLTSEVADAYLQLRLAQNRELVAKAEIARQTRSLDLLVKTATVGLVPESNLLQQRTQLAAAQATLPQILTEEHVQMHALSVLLAKAPDTLTAELSQRRVDPPVPPVIPPGLPSELLRRRPDIRAAERNLAGATADIGVAVADLYPKLSLTGAAELLSSSLSKLFTADSIQITGGAALSFPLLDWGRRKATVRARREAATQAYLDYQRTVLAALRDVDDALVRIATEQQRVAVLTAGVVDAERSVHAVQARYVSGLENLTAVLDAQQALLQTRDTLAQSDGALRRDTVSLYKALGGGWSDMPVPDAPRPRDKKRFPDATGASGS